jgi:hypothetical protein
MTKEYQSGKLNIVANALSWKAELVAMDEDNEPLEWPMGSQG